MVPYYRYRALIQLAIARNESVNKKGIRMDALFSFYFSFCAVYIYDIYVNLSSFYHALYAISRALTWRTLGIPLS